MATIRHYPKMAALKLEARSPEFQPPVPGAVTTRRLEGTLVASRVSKSVPNHLADTSKWHIALYVATTLSQTLYTYFVLCVSL